jgi:hypothetical protein
MNPGLILRKEENLSYGRLMRFHTATVDDFFKLLGQKSDAVKLHQQLHVIQSVDETGLQLAYNSGNQKLLAVKGSRMFTLLLTEEKEKP